MKKYILLITGIFFVGCASKQTKPSIPDSVAYETINFGIKKATYFKIYNDSSAMIGNSVYQFKPYFIPDDHRLYMLQLLSPQRHYADIDTWITNDMKTLKDKMISLYGNPTISLNMSDIKQLEPNRVSWYCKWEFQDKLITVGAARLSDNQNNYYSVDYRNYEAVCEITNKPLKKIADTQQYYIGF